MSLGDKDFPQQWTMKSSQETFKNTEIMQMTQFERGADQEFQWVPDRNQFGPIYVGC